MGDLKNYGKSNRDKLLNLAKQTKGTDYNMILLRFVQERFLYRLSLSAYRKNFFLKGGALLFAHDRFAARPTRDMDFLGDHISRDKENIKRIMLEICSIACEEDGVTFECGEEEIWLEDITVEKEYNGTRVHMTAHMDTIVQPFSIDVGFGDVIIPQPVDLDYPLLLEDLPEVNVAATVADLANAVIALNDGWQAGDQLTFFYGVQTTDAVTGIPRARIYGYKVMLNPGDSTPLLEVVNGVGFTSVASAGSSAGYVLGMDRAIEDGAAVWIHSREDGTGGLKVSTQFMYVDSSVLAGYQTSEAMAGAANSYGGINAQTVFLQPRAGRVTVTPAVVPAGGSGSGTVTTDPGNGGSTEPSGGGNDNPPAGDNGDEG